MGKNETAKHFYMCLIWQKNMSKLFHEQSTSDRTVASILCRSSKAQSPWDTHAETLADPVW